jgi:predicted nucleotide-binding protein
MPYYHVRIRYYDPAKNYEIPDYELDLSTEDVTLLSGQYDKGRVLFKGKWIDSSNVKEIEIRETEYRSTEYFGALTESTIFYSKKYPDVTRKFIKSPPKKEGILKAFFEEAKQRSKNIFIVHGRDDKPKLELARMLEKIGFNVIILSEQPDKGRTIIEKLEQETIDIGYVFVILTPDDIGYQDLLQELSKQYPIVSEFVKNRPIVSSILKSRARQNVILELGYFVGKVGRNKVCCLYKEDVELPSDIHGVLFKKFDNSIEECYKGILEELKGAGYEIKL